MINLPFFKVLNLDIPTHIKYWIIKNKQIPKHLLEIIDQTPPLTLENTLALPLENFKIHGRTEQKQLSGKNLFNEGYFSNSSLYSKTGSYFAYVEMPNTFKTKFYVNMFLKDTSQNLVAGFTTTKSGTFSGGIRILNNGNLSQNVECNFTNAKNVYFAIGNSSRIDLATDIDAIFNNYDIQCTLQSEATPSFEEYCGGQASPNLDYPQPINNVSGDITISVSNEDNTNSQEVVFPLAENQKLMEGDYLADDGIHHVRNQVTLDGTEEGWGTDSQNLLADIRLPGGKKHSSTVTVGNGKSNRFTISNLANARANSNMFALYGTSELIAWFNRNGMTISQFKSWLGNNNVIVEYELATETIDPYTEAQQEAYNNFKNLHGYNNITIVNAISSNLTPNVSLKYYAKGWR